MKTHAVLLPGWLALTLSATVHAADDPIATDRPDFVESSDVVGKGRVQIETSLAWEYDREGILTSRQRSTPTLLRIGLNDNWELRFETDGRMVQRLGDDSGTVRQRGWSDVSVGLKWHVADGDEEQGRPGIAWLFHADVDSGSGTFRGQGVRPSVRLVAEWELPGGLSIGVMPGIYQERNDAGSRYIGTLLSGVVGKQLTERLRGFVELSGQQLASTRNGGNTITADVGLAWLLTRDLQVDGAVSRGLNRNSPDWSWTVGISSRF
ncbi:transporter [Pelomonas cellulosilytica]|uniref:Transporter n=1 Tax=Pelomonas cellulosilytica TaxID=2906762 RepID=A0ABS8Y3B3_9BURK|nr:transporter [Pelomonas sp. P8]MCE4557712.1 transporter [Pelomonas sp. P8]